MQVTVPGWVGLSLLQYKLNLPYPVPFKNKAQVKACYAQKSSNPQSKWDCDKWIKEGGLPKAAGPKSKSPRKKYGK